jgi:hypothetical protein
MTTIAIPPRSSPSAAALAATIPVPVRLPVAHDGRPLQHLSASSYTRFVLCPEDWRQHYLRGERFPATGAMFLGGRVDDTLSLYYKHMLEHGETLTLQQTLDLYRDTWHTGLSEPRGVEWEPELDANDGFRLGRQAIELTLRELVPRLGRPVAVQRRLEYTLAPGLEWSVVCQLDLETIAEDGAPTVVDYKVKSTPLTQAKADHDPQAGLYLAGRWLEHDPAARFAFAQIAKPGPRRKTMAASLVETTRTAGQLRGTLARIAQAASQIAALDARFGPDRPWGFADPGGWKCSARYCSHHGHCPGGAGM